MISYLGTAFSFSLIFSFSYDIFPSRYVWKLFLVLVFTWFGEGGDSYSFSYSYVDLDFISAIEGKYRFELVENCRLGWRRTVGWVGGEL